MLSFLRTKIGLSIVAALIIIGLALFFKFKNPSPNTLVASKVGLIAEASIKDAIKNGSIDTPSLEDLANGTSSPSIEERIAQLQGNSSVSNENITATDRFARNFFERYIEIKKSGAPIDENTGINLVNELLAQDYGGPNEEKTYTESDINLTTSSALVDSKKYGNALGQIFDTPLPKGYENELYIVNRVAETENYAELDKLAQNKDRYQTIRSKIEDLSVPLPMKNAHIAFLNSLSALIDGVKGMMLIKTDPVGATRMIAKYESGLKAIEIISSQVSSYFASKNITFSSTEPGYIFEN
jgi:hypothetical protein